MGDQSKPAIKIGASKNNDECIIFVQDNGIGIDPSHHARIFEIFNQLDPSKGGSGVGLTLIRQIVDLHGGRIWLESDGLGHGSTFSFALPEPE